MDQNNRDLYNLESRIDINDVIETINEKKIVARKRWAILAKALKSPMGSEPSSPTDEFSLRRISSFMLLRTQQLSTIPSLSIRIDSNNQNLNELIMKRKWYKYSIEINNYEFSLNISHNRNRTFSAYDLMGFNNTGNICIWPSEETLSYYICSNLTIFNDKNVLELGGGMSCLAGLFVAKYGQAKYVTVTDGNQLSIENVQLSLNFNEFQSKICCKVLQWNCSKQYEKFDLILCADCLFFDEARNDLIECLWNCLNPNGLILIMAPQRGNTLDQFIIKSELKGFVCKKLFNYNNIVWQKRLELLNNCDYDDNIHYPILIEMTKSILK